MCLIPVRVPQEDLFIHNNHVFRYITKYVVIFFITTLYQRYVTSLLLQRYNPH